jgi:hypothetical protein
VTSSDPPPAGSDPRPEFWWRLQRLFGGQFLGFAIWFN